jgi:hypothetical protein
MNFGKIILQFASLEKKGFGEHSISSELRKSIQNKDHELPLEMLSEIMAFDFCEDYQNKESGWGTYFGPMMVWNNGDGTGTESPSITRVTEEMITYWEKRSAEDINPILRARYSGLVWDFKLKISGSRPDIQIGKDYINALIEIAKGDYLDHEFKAFIKLKRALNLSISLNDSALIETCKKTIIEYETNKSIDNKPGLWGYSFDLLFYNKKVILSKDEKDEIITQLENKLKRLTKISSNNLKIDPWAAEAAAKRLAIHFTKSQDEQNVKRVILKVGKAFDQILDDAPPLQASGWLNHLFQLYKKFGLKQEAEIILNRLRKIGPKTNDDLGTISHSFEIPKKKMTEFISEMTTGDLKNVLKRIAAHFIPIKKQVKEEIIKLSKNTPTLYLIGHQILDEKGRIISTIGPLENDLEGHIIRHVSQNLSFSSIFLREVIVETENRLGLNSNAVIDFIKDSPIINKERLTIIKMGLDAYFDNDFVSAIHLLIPQLEDSIRNIIEITGGNVLKESRRGGFHLRTFDDILRSEVIVNSLGEDFADYMRILFTDPRGWNLRNNVCHGMLAPKMFNIQTADRVFHALISLGLIQEKTK